MKATRIYYDKSGNIIYHIGLEGTGDFPKTIQQELDGFPVDTAVLTITDPAVVKAYYHKLNNRVVDGMLILGDDPPITPPPVIPNYKAEWLAADTVVKKLAVLAKVMGLE